MPEEYVLVHGDLGKFFGRVIEDEPFLVVEMVEGPIKGEVIILHETDDVEFVEKEAAA